MSPMNIRKVQKRRRQGDTSSTESEKEIDNADQERARELTKLHSDGVLNGVVQLGAFHGNYVVSLFPLVVHSACIRRRVDLICSQENNLRTNLVIELSDCPGGLDIFKIVEDFCYGLLQEKNICVSQIVKLIATSKFLEVDILTCRALKFLEERVLISWKGCLSVLATFSSSDLKNVDGQYLFQKCKTALLRNIEIESTDLKSGMRSVSCNLDCLLRIAELLPPSIAESIYHSCRSEQFGLCCGKLDQDVDQILRFSDVNSNNAGSKLDQIPLCTHVRGSENPTVTDGIIKVEYYPAGESEEEGVHWLDGLEAEKDFPSQLRRSSLMVHLVKTMHLESDVKAPARTICISRLRWGFLCSLLLRATDHETYISRALQVATESQAPMGAEERAAGEVLEGKSETTKKIKTELSDEILILEMLVSQALGEVSFWSFKSKQDRDLAQAEGKLDWISKQDARLEFVTDCIEKFDINTLQGIVEHFKIQFCSEHSTILSFAEVLDVAFAKNLRKGRFTVWEASIVYKEFPNDVRPSHDGIFHAFENNFKESSADDVLSIIELLDDAKLSDETWEKLLEEVHHCDPAFLQKFMENRVEKDRLYEEGFTLRDELRVETAHRMKLAKDKVLVESKLENVSRALKEEKEKLTCSICFTRRRNVVCLPCMHFLYCSHCLHMHYRKSKTCPACRGFTSGVLKFHLSL